MDSWRSEGWMGVGGPWLNISGGRRAVLCEGRV